MKTLCAILLLLVAVLGCVRADDVQQQDVVEAAYGYSISISESAQAFCGGTTCQCNGCQQLDCPMTWTTFTAQCSSSAGLCYLYYPGGGQCSFTVGQGSCTLPYGVCSVTATAT